MTSRGSIDLADDDLLHATVLAIHHDEHGFVTDLHLRLRDGRVVEATALAFNDGTADISFWEPTDGES